MPLPEHPSEIFGLYLVRPFINQRSCWQKREPLSRYSHLKPRFIFWRRNNLRKTSRLPKARNKSFHCWSEGWK
jgi:hypothetical protein